mmetsp:Transcript_6240/g.7621  ORF Transcript_6240/g.7621 Transcript_6240/m.7621 type:complete len:156 (-) Transcript_6240:158-625(-)
MTDKMKALNKKENTPPGHNKGLRNSARAFLWVTTVLLLLSRPGLASITSIIALGRVLEGTFFSIKNIKWLTICGVSVVASLMSWFCQSSSDVIDENKGYTLKMILFIISRGIALIGGIILGLILFFAKKNSTDVPISLTRTRDTPIAHATPIFYR